MGEPSNISWVQKELTRLKRYKPGSPCIDINKNGRCDRKDIWIKTYNNNRLPGYNRKVIGDWTDWQAIQRWNAQTLAKLGGIFEWAAKLKSSSPLHTVNILESYLSKRDNILMMYKKVAAAVDNLAVRQNATPKEKLNALFSAMISVGLLRKQRYPLTTEDVTRTPLNPVATAFIAVAIAHEMNWPVHVVRAPKHVFIRWDNGRTRVNADWYVKKFDPNRTDIFPTDKEYMRYLKITPRMVKRGAYLRTLKLKGLTTLILRMRGEARYRRGDLQGAEKDLTDGLKLDPAYVRAWNLLGIIKSDIAENTGSRRKAMEAVKAYKMALKYNPTYIDTMNNLGNAYLDNLEMPKEAIAYYDKALAIQPKHSSSQYNRGRARFKLMQYKKARKDLEAVLPSRSWDPNLHNHLGLVYEELARAIVITGTARQKTALKRKKQGMQAKAIKSFTKAIRLCKTSDRKAEFSFNLASFYHRQKKYRLAAKYYAATIKHDPRDSVAWFKLGTIAEAMSKNSEALKYYGKAIRLAKQRYARAYLRRAAVHIKMRNYQRAAMDLHSAKTLDEDLVDPKLIQSVKSKLSPTK